MGEVLRSSIPTADGGDVARTLAAEVTESFKAMRHYIREVGTCLECVDPNLCQNVGLVERLVDWEESWEFGAQYVQKTRMLKGLCGVVAEIRRAQTSVPLLAELRESYDAEFFLVLPRIIWLAFLKNPEKYSSLFETL